MLVSKIGIISILFTFNFDKKLRYRLIIDILSTLLITTY